MIEKRSLKKTSVQTAVFIPFPSIPSRNRLILYMKYIKDQGGHWGWVAIGSSARGLKIVGLNLFSWIWNIPEDLCLKVQTTLLLRGEERPVGGWHSTGIGNAQDLDAHKVMIEKILQSRTGMLVS